MSRFSNTTRVVLTLAALLGAAGAALAAGADLGQAQKQATNWTAIGMFGIFGQPLGAYVVDGHTAAGHRFAEDPAPYAKDDEAE